MAKFCLWVNKNQGLLSEEPTKGRMGKNILINTIVCRYLFLNCNNILFEKITDLNFKNSGKFELFYRIIPKL